ncbi:putative WAT1-related protein-like [Capsicum annuum]|uniref:S-protein homolog n=1 Tax=Capsicum annuum TaxID=4072 RepID=A0A2G3AP02_CAPAN|nr:putative WAT1-related protein-like [Capsicum annuum]KAF3678967.1 putative WAT1-related protein-like [Capsicum annuum]PHT95971.1 hypothetical protein T459_03853 [Capsicum annuum]
MGYYPYSKILLSLFILSLINIMQMTNAISLIPKITLHFISDLPQNSPLAQVHCKSKDDDLKVRTLRPGDQFDFSFHMNFFATTLYYCSFVWGSKHNTFDVFKLGDNFCGFGNFHKNVQCSWMMRDNGIYWAFGPNPSASKFNFLYPWL